MLQLACMLVAARLQQQLQLLEMLASAAVIIVLTHQLDKLSLAPDTFACCRIHSHEDMQFVAGYTHD